MTGQKWVLHPVYATGIAINAAILLMAVSRAGADPGPLWSLLAEDRLVEWMQFLCFAVIAILLGFAAADRWSRERRITLEVLGLTGLTVLVALAAVEEISWFQRVLGVESPEFFVQNNRQAETNLHNMALGDASLHKTVILKLILLTGLAHNLVLPILARTRPGIRRWVESLGVYLPPLSVSIIYLVLVILSHLLVEHPRKGELGEAFGAVHYLSTVFMAYYAGALYERPALLPEGPARRLGVRLFAVAMLFLLMLAWLLGAGSPLNTTI